jgi:hypothetical protein
LFGAHVGERANQLACDRAAFSREVARKQLGDAKVDDLGNWLGILITDEDIGGLEVSVQDAAVVSVLHAATDLHEELESLTQREVVERNVLGNGRSIDQFHGDVGLAVLRSACVEQSRDVAMFHASDGVALVFKAIEELRAVKFTAENFDRGSTADRNFLMGAIHIAHAALGNE